MAPCCGIHRSGCGLAACRSRLGSSLWFPVSRKGPDNLLFAGRCIGAVDDAWEVMRVIPAAAVTGQAAGFAAALSIRNGIAPSKLNCQTLAQALRYSGIPLHFEELELKRP